jgi:tRNA pseudouridine13 synthase
VDDAPDLPLVTADLPGTGGMLKLAPAHFVVEEIPLYEPCGEGAHVYLTVRREGRTTREVQGVLARAFDLPERDIGCAGQKDKVSRATQTFSLPLASGAAEEIAVRAAAETGLEVLAARRHGNKLGRGHLAGNRFEILVTGVVDDALNRARAIVERLGERGLPNFYGEQRLGAGGRNARRGRRRLDGPGGSWIARMELSAWQSSLFNAWLQERMARAQQDLVFAGDLARKEDTGGLFEVLEPEREQPRFDRLEISTTGPIYGAKMRWANGAPGDLEREVLASSGVEAESLSAARLAGSRRVARVFLRDLSLSADTEGLRLRFRLPKGAYATTALREITKSAITKPAE